MCRPVPGQHGPVSEQRFLSRGDEAGKQGRPMCLPLRHLIGIRGANDVLDANLDGRSR